MGIMKFAASLLGFGAAAAKSSYDLNKQAYSPEVQQGMAEYKYLYGKVPSMKGYNRVLEFDVIHAQIRKDLEEIGPMIDKYFWLIVSIEKNKERYKRLCDEEWRRRIADPNCDPLVKRLRPLCCDGFPDMEYAEAIGWFDWLVKTGQTEYRGKSWRGDDYIQGYATRSAQSDWFAKKHPDFKKAGYSYREYLLELGRKTAYDNGYLPSCQNIDRNRLAGYATLYSGKIRCGWSDYINWETGIPNQTARKKLAESDATGVW